jgi:hypothetical protein
MFMFMFMFMLQVSALGVMKDVSANIYIYIGMYNITKSVSVNKTVVLLLGTPAAFRFRHADCNKQHKST